MKKFAIFCTEYMENSGGIIVMHYLCHLMRQLGVEAYMFPRFANIPINFALMKNSDYTNNINKTFSANEEVFRTRSYKTNPVFNTPVMFETPETGFNADWVVIYPETTFGNPLGAKNVVRWILAPPFQHQEVFTVGKLNFVVIHGLAVGGFNCQGVKVWDRWLDLRYWNVSAFAGGRTSNIRTGTAYSVRKAFGCELEHDPTTSVCIDTLSADEIASVFAKKRKFISYDWASQYSQYAALSGCISVVAHSGKALTGSAIDEAGWRADPSRRGVGYGVEDEDWSRITAPDLKRFVAQDIDRCISLVNDFVRDVSEHFNFAS